MNGCMHGMKEQTNLHACNQKTQSNSYTISSRFYSQMIRFKLMLCLRTSINPMTDIKCIRLPPPLHKRVFYTSSTVSQLISYYFGWLTALPFLKTGLSLLRFQFGFFFIHFICKSLFCWFFFGFGCTLSFCLDEHLL